MKNRKERKKKAAREMHKVIERGEQIKIPKGKRNNYAINMLRGEERQAHEHCSPCSSGCGINLNKSTNQNTNCWLSRLFSREWLAELGWCVGRFRFCFARFFCGKLLPRARSFSMVIA
jgi:hypothetical protein